jgi:hypothetical protein
MITGTWAQRCAADAQARDWAMQYGRGEFYYSQKWGELTAIADGTTTLTDIADAIAAGTATPYQEALAAQYFAQAADYLLGVEEGRVADARSGHEVPGLEADNGEIPRLIDDDEVVSAEFNRNHVENLRDQVHQVAREAVDREDDARRWAEADSEAEYHEAGARAALAADVNDAWRKAVGVEYDQRCADYGNDGRPEDDRHISAEDKAAQAAAVAAIAERTGMPTGAVWDAVRTIAGDYALDHTDTKTLGQPDWDRVADDWADLMDQTRSELPSAERVAEQGAYWDELGESHPAVRETFWERRDDAMLTADVNITREELAAAYNAAGLPAPAWDEAADRAAAAARLAADPALAAEEAAIEASIEAAYGGEEGAADELDTAQRRVIDAAGSVETAEYWLARGEVDPGAGLSEEMPPQWTPETGPQWPVEPRWTSEAGQARLEAKWAAEDAAYAAEQVRLAALPAAQRRDPAVEFIGNSREHQEELTGALDVELVDALDQARAQLAAGDVPEVDRAAHEARIEQLEAETTQSYPQEYSTADDPYDHEFHHGGTADLPPVPAEYTERPDTYRFGPAAPFAEVPALRNGDLAGVQRLQDALYDDGPRSDAAAVPSDAAPDEGAGARRGGDWEGWGDHWDRERAAGESPGKSRVAEAVAAAHAAVEADSERAAEQLAEEQPARTGGRAALTAAAEQAPVMEWGA